MAVKKIHIEISLRDGYDANGTTTFDAPVATTPENLGKMVAETVHILVARDRELWADTEVEIKA